MADAETVIEKLQTVEREVRTLDNEVYMMRVLPYRTSDDLINGVVITFVNITARTKAEEELRQQAEELTRFNAAMVGREQRMIKLKKEVNELTARQGGRPPYDLDFDPDA